MVLSAATAWWFLPFVVPVCIWVAWNDMAFMKIPNLAVITLTLIYLLIGPIALPVSVWLVQWINLPVVLLVGFMLNMTGALGAGDAKFAAAAAPFIMLGDVIEVVFLFSAVLLAAFVTHRLAGRMAAIRRRVPHWRSWTRRDFPMGLALGGTVMGYLAVAAVG